MLNLAPIQFQNLKIQQKNINLNNTIFFNNRLKANYPKDIVCFSGNNYAPKYSDLKDILPQEKTNLTDEDINNIKNKISEKNEELLPNIIKLHNNSLSGKNIIDLMDYIDKSGIRILDMKDRIDNFNNLENIFNSVSKNNTNITKYIKNIPADDVVNLLKTDIFSSRNDIELTPLSEVCKTFVNYYNYKLKKANIPNVDYIGEKTAKQFYSFAMLNSVLDKDAFNEIWFNKNQYVPIYLDRLKKLNDSDLKFLRFAQSNGFTVKENHDGDLAKYPISIDDKVSILNLLSCNRSLINDGMEGINFDNYTRLLNTENPLVGFKIDFPNLKIDLLEQVLLNLQLDKDLVENYIKDFRKCYLEDRKIDKNRQHYWDINYVHLLNSSNNSTVDKRLRPIITMATLNKFNDYIYKEGSIAKINEKNKNSFYNNGIDYEEWTNTQKTQPLTKFWVDKTGKKKKFTVQNWRRNPQESLFDGNYTTCCTGIDKDHGNSFIDFLTNTCTTTIEVRTEKNKVIGMSRLFFAKINNKVSLIVENIEVNNKMSKHYLYNDKLKYEYREMIFDYIRNFAKNLTLNQGKDFPIYFSAKYYKIKNIEQGLKKPEIHSNTDLIGAFPERIYINSYGGVYDPAELMSHDDDDGLKLVISDITEKQPSTFEYDTTDNDSDSNYNYADSPNF